MLKNVQVKVEHQSIPPPVRVVFAFICVHSVSVCNSLHLTPPLPRCVKSTANVCVLTAAAGRVWRRPSPPPVRPPPHGPLAATPQAHR